MINIFAMDIEVLNTRTHAFMHKALARALIEG